jgi:hypothetical protein
MTCLARSLTVALNDQLSAYLALTTLLVITPGSSIAVVMDGVLEGGMRRGIATAVGVATGSTTYAHKCRATQERRIDDVLTGFALIALAARISGIFK